MDLAGWGGGVIHLVMPDSGPPPSLEAPLEVGVDGCECVFVNTYFPMSLGSASSDTSLSAR